MTLYFRLDDSRELFFNSIIFTAFGKMCFFFMCLNAGGIPQSQSKDMSLLPVLGQFLNDAISFMIPSESSNGVAMKPQEN